MNLETIILKEYFEENTDIEWVLRQEGNDSYFFGNINETLFFVICRQPDKFDGFEIVYSLQPCGSGGTSPLFETPNEVAGFVLQVVEKWENGTLQGTNVIRINY